MIGYEGFRDYLSLWTDPDKPAIGAACPTGLILFSWKDILSDAFLMVLLVMELSSLARNRDDY